MGQARREDETREEWKQRLKDEEQERIKKKAGRWIYNFPPRPILNSLKTQGITAQQIKERQDYNRKRHGFNPGEAKNEEE